jgi:nitrate reductase gamma subunit
VLVFAVPGLLVVVLGYAVGYAAIDWVAGLTGADLPASAAEVGGWITGVLLLTGVTAVLLRARRVRRDGGHQK